MEIMSSVLSMPHPMSRALAGGGGIRSIGDPVVVPSAASASAEAIIARAAATAAGALRTNDNISEQTTFSSSSFPRRLHRVLSDPDVWPGAAQWLPDGQSFVVGRPDAFEELVLSSSSSSMHNERFPEFSTPNSKSAKKYPRFARELERWGFERTPDVVEGGDVYAHPLFTRDGGVDARRMMECRRLRLSKSREAVVGLKKRRTGTIGGGGGGGVGSSRSKKITEETAPTKLASALTTSMSLFDSEDMLGSSSSSSSASSSETALDSLRGSRQSSRPPRPAPVVAPRRVSSFAEEIVAAAAPSSLMPSSDNSPKLLPFRAMAPPQLPPKHEL